MFFLIRKFYFLILLGLAIGVPYLLMQNGSGGESRGLLDWLGSISKSTATDESTGTGANLAGMAPANLTSSGAAASQDMPFESVFRFDLTPADVTRMWPQVIRVYEGDSMGFRVALVTGTQPDDLAGSLTYYFGKTNELNRISFLGATGDARRLIRVISAEYQLKEVPTKTAGLYVNGWNSNPKSALRLAYAPRIDSRHQNQQLEVFLELNRSNMRQGLSPQFRQILDHERAAVKWKLF